MFRGPNACYAASLTVLRRVSGVFSRAKTALRALRAKVVNGRNRVQCTPILPNEHSTCFVTVLSVLLESSPALGGGATFPLAPGASMVRAVMRSTRRPAYLRSHHRYRIWPFVLQAPEG